MKMLNRRKLQMIVAILLIAVVHLYDLSSVYSITIINDEFGYVGMGAQMAGYDWTNMLGTSPYYSYGYGIILSLLFRIGLTGVAFFRAAVVLNVIFLIGSFLITCYLADKLIDCKWNVLIALAINLYTSNIFQCKLCWAETLLYFLSWLFIFFIYQLNEIYEMKYLVGIVITAAYMYTVHQRCLSVVIAAVIMVLFVLLNGHSNRTGFCKMIGAFLIFAGLLFIVSEAKQFIVANWYVAESVADKRIAINDYTGQVSKFKRITDPKNFLTMIMGMLGKLYAQSLASGMLILFALTAAIKTFLGKIVKEIKGKTTLKWTHEEVLMLAAALMFLGAWGIATLYKARTLSEQRYYEIVMTRYIDYVTGPMLLSGFYVLVNYKEHIKNIVASLAAMAGLTILTYFQFIKSYHTLFNSVNVASVYPMLRGAVENLKVVLIAGIGVILFSVFLIAIIYVGNYRKKADIGIVIAATVMGGVFAYNGITETAEFIQYKQQEVVEYVNPVIDYIEENEWTGTIYYVGTGNDSYNFLKILQFMLPDQRIELIEEDEIKALKKSNAKDLLISATKELEEFKLDEVKENRIMDTGRLCLYTLDQ